MISLPLAPNTERNPRPIKEKEQDEPVHQGLMEQGSQEAG